MRPELQEAVDYLTKVAGGVFPVHAAPRWIGEFVARKGDVAAEAQALRALHESHFITTEAPRGEDIALCPDYAEYERLARAEQLHLFVLASRSGKIVGNVVFHIAKSRVHGKPVASEEIFFVAEEARKGFTAISFLRYALDALRAAGIYEVIVGTKATFPRSQIVYERLGFKPFAVILGKVL